MTLQVKQTVQEVCIVLTGFLIIGELLCLFLAGGPPTAWSVLKTRAMLGFLLGIVTAVCMIVHMAYTAERAVLLESASANKRMMLFSAIRMLLVLAVLSLAYLSGWFHLLTMFIGVLALKPAIYLHPLVHRRLHGAEEDAGNEEISAARETAQEEADDDFPAEEPKIVRWLERKMYKNGNVYEQYAPDRITADTADTVAVTDSGSHTGG